MRVNEENFTTGDKEDVEPSYVEQIVGNHNQDEGAHPDIRKQITDTQAFYQNAKDRVEGVAETAVNAQSSANKAAVNAQSSADKAAENAEKSEAAAGEAKNAAVVATIAQQAAETARETAVRVYPRIIDGYWHVWDWEKGDVVNSGVPATGPNGEQGEKGEPGPQGEKGEVGEAGQNGKDGYTPQRGVDYWTPEDIAEIKAGVNGDEKPFVIDFGTDPSNMGVGDKTCEEITEAVENGKRIVGKFITDYFEFTSITISMGYVLLYCGRGRWYVWEDIGVRPETNGWEYYADEDIAIDDAMSDSSENAVQNKVIKAYVDEAVKNRLELWRPNIEYKRGDTVLLNVYEHEDAYYTGEYVTQFATCIQDHISDAGQLVQEYITEFWDIDNPEYINAHRDSQGHIIPEYYATKSEIGDIETALLEIEAMADSLIGGDAE